MGERCRNICQVYCAKLSLVWDKRRIITRNCPMRQGSDKITVSIYMNQINQRLTCIVVSVVMYRDTRMYS